MRSIAALMLALAVAMLCLTTAHSQDDMVVVDADAFDNSQRPPSVFVHDEHNEMAEIEECNQCHHVYDDDGTLLEDESSEDQYCSDCHGLEAEGRKPALMDAFHLNCKGCHDAQNKGPVMCGECHRR